MPTISVPTSNRSWPSLALRAIRGRMTGWSSTVPSALFGPRLGDAFGILMYHRIARRPNCWGPGPSWNVTPRRFEAQIRGLLRRGFDAWPLRKVLEFRRRDLLIPRNVFVVTFDDVYSNVYLHAFPVLRRLNVPATLFLATAYLDSEEPFPSDDWPAKGSDEFAASTWLPITTPQCREMQDSGLIELAAHTHTHDDFRGRPAALEADMRECLAVLKDRFGVTAPNFAFPYGTPSLGFAAEELKEAVRAAGAMCSLTTESRLVFPEDDVFSWGRFTAEGFDTAATLAAKLNGWHNAVLDIGRAMRSLCRRRWMVKHS